jgi:pyroglutamyl-peptidase
MPRLVLLTGFEPFGGDRVNPSWEVARRLDEEIIAGLQVRAVRLPVGCARAMRRMRAAVIRFRPRAVLGLGQARGRPALSLERVAINLADEKSRGGSIGPDARPIFPGAPDAYFSRLPLARLVREFRKRDIPASISLTAGAYACNAAMYTALHVLRRRQSVPAGFIHLPYEPRQAARCPDAPRMPLDMMERAVRLAIDVIARDL